MALEPLYLATLLALASLATGWFAVTLMWTVKGWAWRFLPALVGWGMVYHNNVLPQLLEFVRSDVPNHVKLGYVCASLLIVLDLYVIYTFLLGKGRTTRGRRALMAVLFALSHGGVIWYLHNAAGTVCAPFTHFFEICTSYDQLGRTFLLVPIIGYLLMAVVTNEENTYSALSSLGHRVGVSWEGVDFDPEPSMSGAMILETLHLKTLFERVRHFVKKSYNVQAEALQKAQGGVQMLVYFGANFEIADFLRFDEVSEGFALAAAKDDLTQVVRKSAEGRAPEKVLELRLSGKFVEHFNRDTKPAERYGLRMVSATPLRADYYDAATRAFFNELGTIAAQGTMLEAFMEEAQAAYDRLPALRRKEFSFQDYVAMFMALSGKGPTFGQYGFKSN